MGVLGMAIGFEACCEQIMDEWVAKLRAAEARLHPWTKRKQRLDRIRRNKIKRAFKRFW